MKDPNILISSFPKDLKKRLMQYKLDNDIRTMREVWILAAKTLLTGKDNNK